MGDMNARTKVMQHDMHQMVTPGIARVQEETHDYSRESKDTREPDFYGKALLHACNSTGMLIVNGTPD